MFAPVISIISALSHLPLGVVNICTSYLEGFYVVANRDVILTEYGKPDLITRLLMVERHHGLCFRLTTRSYGDEIKYFYHREQGKIEGDLITLGGANYVSGIRHYQNGVRHGCDIHLTASCENIFTRATLYVDGKRKSTVRSREHRPRDRDAYAFVREQESELEIKHDIALPDPGKWYPCSISEGMAHVRNALVPNVDSSPITTKKYQFTAVDPDFDPWKRIPYQYGYRLYYF